MAEPITMGLGAIIWKIAIEPIVDSFKEDYGDSTKEILLKGLKNIKDKIPFTNKELEVIEAEIVDTDVITLTDKNKFLEFVQNNQQIADILDEASKREPNINVVIEKSYNDILIDGNNNSITF